MREALANTLLVAGGIAAFTYCIGGDSKILRGVNAAILLFLGFILALEVMK